MSSDDQDPLVTRDHVVETLRHAGLDARTINETLSDAVLPARLSKVLQYLTRHGITRESLIERMGGSP
ncbi:MAG TPA: hypothetical protein VGH89_18570 [Pseudonocardia sp.]|jgi:hypothetical protein